MVDWQNLLGKLINYFTPTTQSHPCQDEQVGSNHKPFPKKTHSVQQNETKIIQIASPKSSEKPKRTDDGVVTWR